MGIVVVGVMTDMSRAFDAAGFVAVVVAVVAGSAYLARHNV